MRLRWTPAAADDLEAICTYLRLHYPSFAEPTVRVLYQAALSLRTFPARGRVGVIPGTRELVLPHLPYIIVYRTTKASVEILRIYHGAQHR